MSTGEPDRAQLAAWWQAACSDPQHLPVGVEPVQQRWIRAVGRAELPGAGPVFLKQMGFPCAKHQLRYLLRALPARHEAELLAAAAAHGITVPEVLFAGTRRRFGLPWASLLVTRALSAAGEPEPLQICALAARLARAGIWHPDLHRGNFLRTADGAVAVLDLQSARRRPAPLRVGLRVRMAARLIGGLPDPRLLVTEGLVPSDRLEVVSSLALREHRHWLRRRIERCLQNSTEFERRRVEGGTLILRRGAARSGTEIRGGPEIERLWIGDRALEVLDGRQPRLGAWFRKSRWLRNTGAVYIPGPGAEPDLVSVEQELERGYVRYLDLRRDS